MRPDLAGQRRAEAICPGQVLGPESFRVDLRMRYGPKHNSLYEWVANGADIDHSKVIFARSMGDAKDRVLTDYFKDRVVWPIDFDENRVDDNGNPRHVRRWNLGEWP